MNLDEKVRSLCCAIGDTKTKALFQLPHFSTARRSGPGGGVSGQDYYPLGESDFE